MVNFLGVKLPPYPDITFMESMATILRSVNIDFIVTINSVPHAAFIDVDSEEYVIKNRFGTSIVFMRTDEQQKVV